MKEGRGLLYMLKTIRKYTPNFILKLYQIDSLMYKLDRLRDEQDMLKRLIKKEDLYSVSIP